MAAAGARFAAVSVPAAVTWRDAVFLFHYPFPVGVDGFYYAGRSSP
jgi:hypothetical protein